MTPTETQTKPNALEGIFAASKSSAEYAGQFFQHMAGVMRLVEPAAVARQIELIERAGAENKSIFFVANGGSSAVASHIVNDLGPNSLVLGKPGFRAFCLSDNVESITAIANDSCFENVFSYQLRHNMAPGDLVVGLSVSGNSENIIRAIDYANENGGVTAGWCGMEGGRLAARAKNVLHIPSTRDEYGPVEDLFSVLGHIITGYLTMKRGKKLAH